MTGDSPQLEFGAVSFASALHADPRPTCVLDIQAKEGTAIAFKNQALQEKELLVDDILDSSTSTEVQAWALQPNVHGTRSASSGHSLWLQTIDKRWRVIQWQWQAPERTESGSKDHTPRIAPATKDASVTLREALADRDDATGKLQNILKMMEMVDVGIFEYDEKGILQYGNNAFYKLSGHPRNSKRDTITWKDSVFPEDEPWLFEHWTQMTKGIALTFEMKWKRPAAMMPGGVEDTEAQWVLAACVPTTDNEGNVLTVSGCLTDIAAQKQSQSDALKRVEAMERAYASEKRFSTFAEQANIGIWILKRDLQMTYANKEWFRITNHPLADYSDVDWTTVMDSANLEIIHSKLEEMRATKRPLKFELELLRLWADGQGATMKTTALAAAYPELSDTGDILAFAGTLTDITHLRWAERLQKLRTDEAIEAKRQQEHFIDMTCHEIRNPLGAVLHCADLARSSLLELRGSVSGIDALPSETETSNPRQLWDSTLEAANIIISCCAHQRRIVDDILTLSKLDSKLLTIAPAPVKLSNMLTEVTRMFEVDAQKADVVFSTATEASLSMLKSGWAVLDRGRLMQVLINLITNSLKFTQKEAVRAVTLTVGASQTRPVEQDLGVDYVPAGIARDRVQLDTQWGSGQDIYLTFKVIDTGCGFNDEQKGRIFERFSQASPRTHSKYGGSGLGLFISREMIELQSGEIGVSSRPGHGSTFAFYVAARIAEALPVAGDVSRPRAIQRRSTHENGRAKYTILVVEDNLVNQKVLRMQLQKLGHIVHVVSNGVEALQFLETTLCWTDRDTSSKSDPTIDLSVILMDMEMPVMGGIECARRIRRLQNEGRIVRHLPIISVSANARDAQIGSALESGMDDAISKPFRVADLMPKIAALVDS